MAFNSIPFLIFFPLVALFYFLIPNKFRWLWLLIASYFFYMSWNPFYGILLLMVTVVSWGTGLLLGWIDKNMINQGLLNQGMVNRNVRKICLIIGIILTLSLLFYFKYTDFLYNNVKSLLSLFGVGINPISFDIIMPIGISFYSFQALGYVIDIYRKEIEPEPNFFRHALFVSFFPQLLAGPIGRAKDLKPQLLASSVFNYEDARYGLLLMGWGYFQKMMVADRAAVLVNSVYDDFYFVSGYQVVIATFLFSFQIYCDFTAYSLIALGAARIMGIRLIDNFRQPYFAISLKEFWHRWHISLSTWFRDYLYIPLGGNRCSRTKRYRNIMLTFLLSGLWHGASFNFIAWGGLHGIYLITGDSIKKFSAKFNKGIRILVTFLLVSFAWIFFRANGLAAAIHMIRRIFTNPLTGAVNDNWIFNPALLIGIIMLLVVELIREKRNIFALLFEQKAIVRWLVYYALILTIIVLGIYGADYIQTQFVYFKF